MKIGWRFWVLLLILVCLPLLSSFSKYDKSNAELPSAYEQTSSTFSAIVSFSDNMKISSGISKADEIRYIDRNAFTLMAYDFLLMDDGVIQSDFAQFHAQYSFDDWNIYSMTSFYVLLCGLIFVFMCFGTLSVMLFVRGFIRYTMIPHSIHAPPYYCRETFEIKGQIC